MANGKSTWKYNKLLTARKNYFKFGDFLFKPGKNGEVTNRNFSNLSSLGEGILSTAGTTVGQIGGGLIGGGLQSGIGSMAQGLSGIASSIPIIGGPLSAGLGIFGGITNRLFGSKMNQGNIAKVESNINDLNNFQSNTSDYDTLANNWANSPVGMTFDNSFIGKDGVFSNKVGNKANDLRAQVYYGNEKVQNALLNNAANINNMQIENLLGNYAAFGGELNTQGGDFTNGLISINAGGSHEINPNEGVPMGTDSEGVPNLVEEGETIFNDYVFSKRLKVPKAIRDKYKLRGVKDLSFADASKKLAEESKERPNDPISIRGLNAFMNDLTMAQEYVKQQKELKENQEVNKFDQGGYSGEWNDNYVKPGLEGTPMWFAQNLNEQVIDPFNMGTTMDDYVNPVNISNIPEKPTDWTGVYRYMRDYKGNVPDKPITKGVILNPTNETPTIIKPDGSTTYKQVIETTNPDYGTKAQEYLNKNNDISTDIKGSPTWMRYIPAFASGVMSLTDALGLTNKPNYREADMVLNAARNSGKYSPIKYNPIGNYMRYKPLDRDYILNTMNAQSESTRRALINNAGLNRGTLAASMLASDYNALNAVGDAIMKQELANREQEQRVEEFNRATNIQNSTGFLEADKANQAALMNTRSAYLNGILSAAQMRQAERQAASQSRSLNLSNFINSLGDIGRENYQRNMIVSDPSKYYTIDKNGNVIYKGAYHDLDDSAKKFIDNDIKANPDYKGNKKSRGGYLTINRKKK